MNRKPFPAWAVALLLLLVPLGGCGGYSRLEKAYATRTLFNEGLRELVALKPVSKGGLVPDQQFKIAVAAANLAEPSLDELDRAALSNDPFKWQTALNQSQTRIGDFLKAMSAVRQHKQN